MLNCFSRWCQRCLDGFACLDLTVALCMCKVWLNVYSAYKPALEFSVLFCQKVKTAVLQSGKQWIVIQAPCPGTDTMHLQKEPSKPLRNSIHIFKWASNVLGHQNVGFVSAIWLWIYSFQLFHILLLNIGKICSSWTHVVIDTASRFWVVCG